MLREAMVSGVPVPLQVACKARHWRRAVAVARRAAGSRRTGPRGVAAQHASALSNRTLVIGTRSRAVTPLASSGPPR
jgi:hypothetical protein